MLDVIRFCVQTVEPESALERALLDREEALHRVEADLQRERLNQRVRVQELQKQLDKAFKVCVDAVLVSDTAGSSHCAPALLELHSKTRICSCRHILVGSAGWPAGQEGGR